MLNHVMTKDGSQSNQVGQDESELQLDAEKRDSSASVIRVLLLRVKATIEERNRHLRTKEDVQLLALVANTILFIAMAEMIDINLLWKYRVEIIAMFLATTVIRAVMIWLFAWVANRTDKMANVNVRWGGVLTFAGIKGGLSIVMLTMIPTSFVHLEMFKAVVIGVIMLSTFLYSGALLLMITHYKSEFLLEKEAEHTNFPKS